MKKGDIRNEIVGDVPAWTVSQRLNQMTNYINESIKDQDAYIQENAVKGDPGRDGTNGRNALEVKPFSLATLPNVLDDIQLTGISYNRTPVATDIFSTIVYINDQQRNFWITFYLVSGEGSNWEATVYSIGLAQGKDGEPGEQGLPGAGIDSVTSVSHEVVGNETITHCQVNYQEEGKTPTTFDVHAQNGNSGAPSRYGHAISLRVRNQSGVSIGQTHFYIETNDPTPYVNNTVINAVLIAWSREPMGNPDILYSPSPFISNGAGSATDYTSNMSYNKQTGAFTAGHGTIGSVTTYSYTSGSIVECHDIVTLV